PPTTPPHSRTLDPVFCRLPLVSQITCDGHCVGDIRHVRKHIAVGSRAILLYVQITDRSNIDAVLRHAADPSLAPMISVKPHLWTSISKSAEENMRPRHIRLSGDGRRRWCIRRSRSSSISQPGTFSRSLG